MDILFFCDDLDHYFSLGSTYTDEYQASSLSLLPGTFGNKLSRLFTETYNSGTPTDTTVESVGFQLAVWDLQYETVAARTTYRMGRSLASLLQPRLQKPTRFSL
jgi:hypothetical protein